MQAMRRTLVSLAILATGLLLAALLVLLRPEPEMAPPEVSLPLVRVMKVNPTQHRFVVKSQGTVTPRTEMDLVAEVAGRVVHVAPAFRPGGLFRKGDLLVALESTDYELAVTRARAALVQAESNLLREEAEARVAREEWEENGLGPPHPLALREPQLAQARAAVESARATLLQAQHDLERCRVTAPFDGRVLAQRVDLGQFISRGQVLGRIHALDCAEVRVPLALDDLAFLDLPLALAETNGEAAGPEVALSARIGGRDCTWHGRIARTEGEVDLRTRMLHAVVRVERPYEARNGQPPLVVGLFVHAAIRGRTVSNVYVAPRKAFRHDRELMVVDADNRLRLRAVDILRRERDRVVFRGGLGPGERICITPLDVATDGMQVRILAETDGDTVSMPAAATEPARP